MDPLAEKPEALTPAPVQIPEPRTPPPPTRIDGLPPIPAELPILPVRGTVVFPGTVAPLTVGREKSKRLIDDVLAGNKLLAVFSQRRNDIEDPGIDDIYRVGTAALILKLLRLPDGTTSLLIHGLARVGLEELIATEPYWRARVNPHEDQSGPSLELRALAHNAKETAQQVLELTPNVPEEAEIVLNTIDEPGPLADFLAANLSLGVELKQELLETFDVPDRLRKVTATLNDQLEILRLSQKIQTDMKAQVDKSQREYYLHEQLKAIQKELGEADTRGKDLEDLRAKIDAAKMPEAVLREANREFDRLNRISPVSPENGVIRDYLDWLCELPWQMGTIDSLDLPAARAVLEADHYGLEKIKRRIIEYLAVRKLKPDGRSPILCFVGPPGVGKTSLGQSIARALGRKFIRIALGGVRDEADIRGHRRTYIGAIPGRIIQELRKSGSNNPVIMLDELDKLGADFRGDPASALLEVLDPAQNHSFTDHYLGVPFDLSRVLFIATANYMDPVPSALRDRMEVIELPGYTTAEKLKIAQRYLVKRQREENGLGNVSVAFPDETLRAIIEEHTNEAGVRNLERAIGSVFRGLASKVAEGETVPKKVSQSALAKYLGQPRFLRDAALISARPGVVTGLAYTPAGGEIIFVETVAMPGNGGFMLTGQIGDVMRESAQAALSLVKARRETWGFPIRNPREVDMHIHVPAGGIPKDGPSAGVAMLLAIVSQLSDLPVQPTLGLSGEVTLRGDVLPVGGIREKLLAAQRAGLKTVVLPERNRPDVDEIPMEVRRDVQIEFARTADDVLRIAFGAIRSRAPKSRGKKKPGTGQVTPHKRAAERGPARSTDGLRGNVQPARRRGDPRRRATTRAARSGGP